MEVAGAAAKGVGESGRGGAGAGDGLLGLARRRCRRGEGACFYSAHAASTEETRRSKTDRQKRTHNNIITRALHRCRLCIHEELKGMPVSRQSRR